VAADVDHVHVKRIDLVGFSYIIIEDSTKTLISLGATSSQTQIISTVLFTIVTKIKKVSNNLTNGLTTENPSKVVGTLQNAHGKFKLPSTNLY
jgi:hypothetical protein